MDRTITFYRNDTMVQKCSDIHTERYRLAVTIKGGKKGAAVSISGYDVDYKGYLPSNGSKRGNAHFDDEKQSQMNGAKGTRVSRVVSDGSGMVEQLLELIEKQKEEISQLKQVRILLQ